jgi:hypothetical protein
MVEARRVSGGHGEADPYFGGDSRLGYGAWNVFELWPVRTSSFARVRLIFRRAVRRYLRGEVFRANRIRSRSHWLSRPSVRR